MICKGCNKTLVEGETFYKCSDGGYFHQHFHDCEKYKRLTEIPKVEYNERRVIVNTESPKPPARNSWDVYFIEQSESVSTRSTCDRKHCGAVVTKNNRIRGTGYNGSEPNAPHCDDVGHFMVNDHCVRTIHAEVNAIKDAKEVLTSLEGCKIYINTYPCVNCFWLILKEGIKEIFYKDLYRKDDMIEKVAELFGVTLQQIDIGNKHV